MKVNLFDFDKTIYDGDSTIDFYIYCLKRKIYIIKYIPIFIVYLVLYKLKIVPKEKMKEKFFLFLKCFNNIDEYIEEFWKSHENKIKSFYLERNHSNDIIISASPYFLLQPISKKLKVKDLIASDVNKKNGIFNGRNCYGIEKVNKIKNKYNNLIVHEAYSDSLSDLPLFKIANKSYLVKGNNIINYDINKK